MSEHTVESVQAVVRPHPSARIERHPMTSDWMDQALCAQVDHDLFYPDPGATLRTAKSICAACNVRAECLTYALENHEPFGIWGGLSALQRRKLKPPRVCALPGCELEPRTNGARYCSDDHRDIARAAWLAARDQRKAAS